MKTGQKAHILIADDDARNRKLMLAMLDPLGHEIRMADDGDKVLEAVQSTGIDLIILDIMMPRMNGYQVLEHIKGDPATRDIPVIVLTALSDTDSRIRAFDLGADDFISKPPERTQVVSRTRSLLKAKAYHDELARYRDELEKEVERITEQLHAAYRSLKTASLDTIYRLTQASEFKDEDTGAHIQRVSKLSQAMARKMGLPEHIQETLLYAAPMHDVGKIGIPDEILLKPGSLDAEEWKVMKTHSQIGARILRGSDSGILRMGEEIALTHHERWDGEGYPAGLERHKIPITGRIVAVADVFDALTSFRPYRGPIDDEEALAYLESRAGSQFDPAVVDAFLSLGEEIYEIRKDVKEENTRQMTDGAGPEVDHTQDGGDRKTH